jgi:putative addiction module killer protein
MYRLEFTTVFTDWLESLRDRVARARILDRLLRVESGNFGDHKSVGEGVFEMRLTYGPGYRLYYILDGINVVVLLCGGDKSSQRLDVRTARDLAKEWRS